jgi:fumarate hydratase, class I
MNEFKYQEPFPLLKDDTKYRLLTKDYISLDEFKGRKILKIDPEGIEFLAREAFTDVSFYLRPSHLKKLEKILHDPEASDNDRFVAYTMLLNQVISAEGQLPTCQDTGTAIVTGWKGGNVYTGVNDAEYLSRGIFSAFRENNLRYSQIAPLSMFEEKNTGTNLPAQIDIYSNEGDVYKFLFIAKGGGSGNKSFLFQKSKSLLTEDNLASFIREKINELGTSACPPYHLAIVIGGTSAEANLRAVKMASAGYYDGLPHSGNEWGRAFRDPGWEKRVERISMDSGIGAQFGGKYFVHDVRVIRLPRHAASCHVGIGVSCSADRNIKAKITHEGIFLEELEKNPEQFVPRTIPHFQPAIDIDLDQPIPLVLKELAGYPVKTRLNLNGTMIVARDAAHAKIKKMLEEGKPLPGYFKNHPVYYAGPAKTPEGMVTGSFGPTTSARMDPYVKMFMEHRGSLIMVGKGNRSAKVARACKKHGGFYLGSIGGPAAILAKNSIKSMELIDFEELGMEAVRKIKVENFPAFIIIDNKGNDFFEEI